MAKPRSIVFTKNSANALAPCAVCFVAPVGITGGFSAFEATFGPVRGTSAGTVGCACCVGRVGCGREVLAGAGDLDAGAVLADKDRLGCALDVEGPAADDVAGA